MKLGEIYVWETEKAKGHDSRRKYHVFICEADSLGENTFLFISRNDFFDDYEIAKRDYCAEDQEAG